MSHRVFVTGPRDRTADRPPSEPGKCVVVNTTSRAGWSSALSPFKLGPCKLYKSAPILLARTMENLWQYAKVYPEHIRSNGEPGRRYFEWAVSGWENPRAVRYPMGKGAKPLYSYWNGEHLDYIPARKRIYVRKYARAVIQTDAYLRLKKLLRTQDVVLWDFDGYNHKAQNRDWEYVLNDPTRPCGHAFVLAALLEHDLDEDKFS